MGRSAGSAGAVAVAWAAAVAIVAPAAVAAPSWQPAEGPPAGTKVVAAGGGTVAGIHSKTWLDASGNAFSLVLPATGTPFRFGVRPRGGPFGAATPLPANFGTSSAPMIAPNLAGDAVLWDFTSRRATLRPAGLAAAFGPLGAGLTGLADARLLDSGQALGLSDTGNQTRVLFRAAGAATDFAGPVDLPPADGDTSSVPIGLAYDPSGQAVALYRSKPSGTLLQTSTTGDPPIFGTPVAIPNPATNYHFDASANGHAIVAWGEALDANQSPRRIVAAVREPGGAFGAPQTVVQTAGGSDVIGGFLVAATDSGRPVIAYTRLADGIGSGCPPPTAVVEASVRANGIWQPPAPVTGSYALLDQLVATGDRVGLVARAETTGADGDGCTSSDNVYSLRVALGTGAAGAAGSSSVFGPATTLAENEPGLSVQSEDLALNAGDEALFVYRFGITQFVRAFEDRAVQPPAGPTLPASPSGVPATPPPAAPGVPAPVRAPGGIRITGPIKVDPTDRIILRGECFVENTPCRFILVLGRPLGGNRSSVSAVRLRSLGTVSATVPAGATRNIRLKLNAAGRRLVRSRSTVKVTLKTTVKAGSVTRTTTRGITLRRAASRPR